MWATILLIDMLLWALAAGSICWDDYTYDRRVAELVAKYPSDHPDRLP